MDIGPTLVLSAAPNLDEAGTRLSAAAILAKPFGLEELGGWIQRPDGEIVTRLLEDVGAEAESAIEQRVGEVRGWLGAVRVIPRFRTPLEQELVASV